jgi:amidase
MRLDEYARHDALGLAQRVADGEVSPTELAALAAEAIAAINHELNEYASQMKPAQFLAAMAALNGARRQLGAWFTRHDVWLSPTRARVAEPWGQYNLGRADVSIEELPEKLYRPVCQYALPHNMMGTPAISLPLGVSADGMPIGVQFAAAPPNEHLVLQLAAALEVAMPWREWVPPLHAANLA